MTTAPTKQTTPLVILDETPFCFVIYKPPGVSFHREDQESGVMEQLRERLAQHASTQEHDLHPVHRLDKVTSGLLLVAKTKADAKELSECFPSKRIQKWYIALASKSPSKKQGGIIGDMVRSRRGTWKLTRNRENPAKTRFVSASVQDARPGLRCFLLQPETGKTHQLRVAMKSLGSPVLGDQLYGPLHEAKAEDRTYLHAYALTLSFRGEEYMWVCPPKEGSEFQTLAFRTALSQAIDKSELRDATSI